MVGVSVLPGLLRVGGLRALRVGCEQTMAGLCPQFSREISCPEFAKGLGDRLMTLARSHPQSGSAPHMQVSRASNENTGVCRNCVYYKGQLSELPGSRFARQVALQ